MPLMAKDTGGGGDYTPVPEGTHLAICNMVVDLGLQETTYLGNATTKHQCYIRWELPHERLKWQDRDGNEREGPMSIGKTYTLSLSDKANLRKDLETWRGKAFTEQELDGFDLFNLLVKGCQVTVVHAHKEGKTYANVRGIAGWPKGVPIPQTTENSVLKYSDDTREDHDDLPDWIREKIAKQVFPDHKVNQPGDPGATPDDTHDLDDEIPF